MRWGHSMTLNVFRSVTLTLLLGLSASSQAQTTAPASTVPTFKKVMIVVLENEGRDPAIAQPFLGNLAKAGGYLSNSWGVARPSQPNYLAMVAGSTLQSLTNDNVDLEARHLGDLLEAQGKTWK